MATHQMVALLQILRVEASPLTTVHLQESYLVQKPLALVVLWVGGVMQTAK